MAESERFGITLDKVEKVYCCLCKDNKYITEETLGRWRKSLIGRFYLFTLYFWSGQNGGPCWTRAGSRSYLSHSYPIEKNMKLNMNSAWERAYSVKARQTYANMSIQKNWGHNHKFECEAEDKIPKQQVKKDQCIRNIKMCRKSLMCSL